MSEPAISFATAGEPHQMAPEDLPEWAISPSYFVVPWHCPQCEQVVAETLVEPGKRSTKLTIGPATHQPAADRDGLRYYGPTRRAMRGKTSRRSSTRLSRGALLRRSPDYMPIVDASFDTLCDNCPLRVRISLPQG